MHTVLTMQMSMHTETTESYLIELLSDKMRVEDTTMKCWVSSVLFSTITNSNGGWRGIDKYLETQRNGWFTNPNIKNHMMVVINILDQNTKWQTWWDTS